MKPALILAGNPYTLEGRIATRVGQTCGILTAALEHGSIFSYDPIWEDCILDLVCAWGEPSRRALLSCGVHEEQIAVTGAPHLDDMLNLFKARKGRLRITFSQIFWSQLQGREIRSVWKKHRLFIHLLYEAAERTA